MDGITEPVALEHIGASFTLWTVLQTCILLCICALGRMLFCMWNYVLSIASCAFPSYLRQLFQVSFSEAVCQYKHIVSSPTTNSTIPSLSLRNQCVFVRGYKLSDKSTMTKQLFVLTNHFQKNPESVQRSQETECNWMFGDQLDMPHSISNFIMSPSLMTMDVNQFSI